jgi:hypothetical protein
MEFHSETIPKLKIFESAPGYIVTGQIKCHLQAGFILNGLKKYRALWQRAARARYVKKRTLVDIL